MIKTGLFIIIITVLAMSFIYGINRRDGKCNEILDHVSINSPEPIIPEMLYIKGGTFHMGNNGGYDNEKPVHSVTLNDFYMGKNEVTNEEYRRYEPKHKGRWKNNNYPVESVTWEKAVKYCRWLSEKTGKTYRLPTEAEWEYACRGGADTKYYWGNTIDGSYCWYGDNSSNTIHPVGQKLPNSYGLHDMNGNVMEWCLDWYGLYDGADKVNPTGPSSGSDRVFRGGSWFNSGDFCYSSYRERNMPSYNSDGLGFRVVMVP